MTDAFHTALAGLLTALALTACERAPTDGPYLQCTAGCMSAIVEVTP